MSENVLIVNLESEIMGLNSKPMIINDSGTNQPKIMTVRDCFQIAFNMIPAEKHKDFSFVSKFNALFDKLSAEKELIIDNPNDKKFLTDVILDCSSITITPKRQVLKLLNAFNL